MFLRPIRDPRIVATRSRRLIKSMVLNAWLYEFQCIWYNEYLLKFRERSHGCFQVPFRKRLMVNDVVLVRSPLKPRTFWILEIVLELFRWDDDVTSNRVTGLCRSTP